MAEKLTYEELEQRVKSLEKIEFHYINKQRLILAAIHDGLWENDFKNSFFQFSDNMFTMLGYSPLDGIKGYEFLMSKLHHEDIKHLEYELQRFNSGELKTWQIVFRLQAADGSWRYILSRGNCIAKDENGVGYHYVGTHTDITENKLTESKQKELEATNRRLQKSESLGNMAGGIAHLFNNYLYVVIGNLELALEDLPKNSPIRKNLINAMKATRRCSDVSSTMLTYLGQTNVKTEPIDISEFCRNNLSTFKLLVKRSITIQTELSDTPMIVRANTSQMEQVITHLINNASESIGENRGKISLITKTIKSSDISKFHLFPADSKPFVDIYGCFGVTDTGCGIPAEDIYKLCDPFFTTKFTGRGLGLAAVLGIVKSWNGMVGVNSDIGHGSSFMIFLPLSVDSAVKHSGKLEQTPRIKKYSTVLVVDDHEMVRAMAMIMLKRIGFEVLSAKNGVEAIEMFKKNIESVVCLITDLSMPELDGWATLAAIRKIKPNIPAILASGYDEAFAMSNDNSEKVQAFLHKPYSIKDLKVALEQALRA
ncbi:MAG: response regulator [Desulfamplus sp.]|nr:response regulator [Desulfamplus sp.]